MLRFITKCIDGASVFAPRLLLYLSHSKYRARDTTPPRQARCI